MPITSTFERHDNYLHDLLILVFTHTQQHQYLNSFCCFASIHFEHIFPVQWAQFRQSSSDHRHEHWRVRRSYSFDKRSGVEPQWFYFNEKHISNSLAQALVYMCTFTCVFPKRTLSWVPSRCNVARPHYDTHSKCLCIGLQNKNGGLPVTGYLSLAVATPVRCEIRFELERTDVWAVRVQLSFNSPIPCYLEKYTSRDIRTFTNGYLATRIVPTNVALDTWRSRAFSVQQLSVMQRWLTLCQWHHFHNRRPRLYVWEYSRRPQNTR